MQIDRRALVAAADGFRTKVGARAWRRLIHCLIEHEALFGPLGYQLGHPERVGFESFYSIFPCL